MNKYKKIKTEILSLNELPIYIAGHIKPDQDSICSCLALAEWLSLNKKTAYVLVKSGDENLIDWFGGSNLIKNKIDDEKYNFIALDLNDMTRLGDFYEGFKSANYSINIDHHQGNDYQANLTISQPNMSSTCEIIYEIIKSEKIAQLKKSICELLYSGMMNDTNCFSRRLSKNTMKIAQNLINCGVDYARIIKQTYSSRTLYSFKALAKIVSEINVKDGIYYSVIDKNLPEFSSLTHNQIVKQIAEDIRKIDSIDIYIMMIKTDDTIVGKVMTNISESACDIATMLGGGGHKKEAGFTIKNVMPNDIINKISNFLNK